MSSELFVNGTLIGTAASGDFTDKNTGCVTVQTGQTAKVPLRLAEEYSGNFEVRVHDPEVHEFFLHLGFISKI